MVHAVTPIIPLHTGSDFDVKELQYLKHSKKIVHAIGDEEYTEVRVPIIDSGASDEELLYHRYTRTHVNFCTTQPRHELGNAGEQ
jgi:hypothetical protein